ncbi:HsdS protein [Burkholderia pseudomallei]|nr:HsdS protein [Burkholderia pseudomallei]
MSSNPVWPCMTLREAGVTLIDCDHRTPPAQDSGYPYIAIPQLRDGHIRLDGSERRISASDYADWTKKLMPQQHDVIVVRRCNSGDSAVVPAGLKCAIGQNLVVLRSDGSKVFPPFLRWLVRSDEWREQVRKYLNVGAVFDSLKCKEIPLFELPVPPLDVQREIALLLQAVDDRITLLRETNATLEAIAQALFKSWFVDFDPVRANQEGRALDGMDEATAALFPDAFEELEFGVVPKGWRSGVIEQLAVLNPESWTAKKHPASIAYIDLANVKDNEIAVVTNFSFGEAPSRARRVMRHGDTIVGTVRPGNRSFAYISKPIESLTASTGFAVLRPTRAQNAEFVYLAATCNSSIEHLAHVADGGAYPAVRPEVVASLRCCLPSDAVMDAFHEIAEPLVDRVAENQERARTLAALRDALLPRLISGQLRLCESEAGALAA